MLVSKKYQLSIPEADNALDGGVTDWVNIEQLPSFYEEVKNLKVGQISKIIESQWISHYTNL